MEESHDYKRKMWRLWFCNNVFCEVVIAFVVRSQTNDKRQSFCQDLIRVFDWINCCTIYDEKVHIQRVSSRPKTATADPTFYCMKSKFYFYYAGASIYPRVVSFWIISQKCKFDFVSNEKKILIRIRSKIFTNSKRTTVGTIGWRRKFSQAKKVKNETVVEFNKYQPALAPSISLASFLFSRHYELLGALLIDWFSTWL